MSSKTIKGIIFDLDGTLLDTLGDLTTAINATADFYTLPHLTQEEVRNNIGNGFVVTITKSLPGLNASEIPSAVERFKAFYATFFMNESRAYEGINELLDELVKRGIRSCVVSNKVQSFVEKLISSRFPQFHFDLVYGENESHLRKPHPQGLLEACKAMDLEIDEVLMIGDSKADYESALSIKMPMKAVTWGFSSEEELKSLGIKTLVRSPQEILEAL
jgi:phosphoglycolate phosphatase